MSERLRDKKGRLMPPGVRQRSDGRYEYRYIDDLGERRSVYSWRLNKTDKTPKGKMGKLSIVEMIKQIQTDMDDGIDYEASNITVYELCNRYIATRTGVTHNTYSGYKTTLSFLDKHPFGRKKIREVKTSTAKLFLIGMQKDYGKSYSSIHNVRGVLRPAFQMAYEDDILRKNPFNFQLHEVLVDDRHKRDAISAENMNKFLKFVKEDETYSAYYEMFFILFNTGLRISELCGLTISDVDLKKKTLTVDHQLQRDRSGSLYIMDKHSKRERTKTAAGTRTIPITDEVCDAFKSAIKKRGTPIVEPMVDGHTGFVWLNYRTRKGLRPYVGMDWEHVFSRAVEKYNSIYRIPMPKITPHVCRHTYCTQMAKKGMNPAMLQFLMGHSDITVTMNYYTHLRTEDAQEELNRMNTTVESKVIDFK